MQTQKEAIVIALKKARTSIDKIIARVEANDDQAQCFDVMQQTLSVIGLLKNANNHILEQHLAEYLKGLGSAKLSAPKIAQVQAEIVKILQTAQKK